MCERQEAIIKESYTEQPHTHTHTHTTTVTQASEESNLCFGGFTLKIYRKGKTTMLHLFYFQLPVSYKAWNEIKKHADFRKFIKDARSDAVSN